MAAGWKTVRVFISSTFRDMHAERDHLVRIVFPELKERCRKIHVQLIDVDLRWGVSEEDAESGKVLDICLDEIDTCRPYFVGILGHRYGYVPEGHRHSITAQEIYHGVLHGSVPKQVVNLNRILEERLEGQTLSKKQKECLARCYRWDADKRKHFLREDITPEDTDVIRSVFECYSIYQKDRSFFFFRNEAFTRRMAGSKTADYFEQKRENQDKLGALKQAIIDEKLPYFEYADIEAFGQLVLNRIWERIKAEAEQAPGEEIDWLGQEDEFHELFMAYRTRRFVGRRELLDRMLAFCDSTGEPSLLVITGEPGCGKSALMARFVEEALCRHPERLILSHFVGASSSSTNLRQMLRRLSTHFNRAIGTNENVPEDIKELLKLFPGLLVKACERRPLLIIIDAANQLEKSDNAHSMCWLPQTLPKNVRVVISTLLGEVCDAILARRIKPQEETVAGLSSPEVKELVEAYLREIHHEFPNPEVERSFYRKVGQGNPLYILAALEELRVFGLFEKLGNRINRFPDNLPALFDQMLERIESDFNPRLVCDCMSYIACGQHGMTAEELQTLLKAHAPRIEPNAEAPKLPDMLWARLYRSLGAYLFDRSGVVDFFHVQLKIAVGDRYLRDESRRLSVHQAIADYFAKRWREPYARALDELSHQYVKAKNGKALVGVLCDLEFIELKCQAAMTYDLVLDYESASKAECVPPESMTDLGDFAQLIRAQCHVLAKNPGLTFQQAANEPASTAPAQIAETRFKAGSEKRIWFRRLNKPKYRSTCLMTLVGHSKPVKRCTFSPNGDRIVSISEDRTLRLWDVHTGQELINLWGPESPRSCVFSPDGSKFASASSFNTLKIWDASTGQELDAIIVKGLNIEARGFSPDGERLLLTSSFDSEEDGHIVNLNQRIQKLIIWDLKGKKEINSIEITDGYFINAFVISPEGAHIAFASRYHTLELWDIRTGQKLTALKGHSDDVLDCVFSPDGSRIASASMDRTLKIWDAATGRELLTLIGHSLWVSACSFSPDGSHLLSASGDRTLKLWDAHTGRELATLRGHFNKLNDCDFSPDGTQIASASDDCTVKLWDSKIRDEQRIQAAHTSEVTACAFSPDGKRIASGSSEMLKLWDANTGQELSTQKIDYWRVGWFRFSPNSIGLLAASDSWAYELWDTNTGSNLIRYLGHSMDVTACVFSPDGNRIASCLWGKKIKLWDAVTGHELHTLKGHSWDVNACAFSPDGRRLVSASADKTLILWDVDSGKRLFKLKGHFWGANACAFSPDGLRIVSASTDKTLKLWSATTGHELVTFKGHSGAVMWCAFSPDGKRIVSASQDTTLKIWDANNGRELATLSGHSYGVTSCTFSHDGRRIISYSRLNEKILWDADTGQGIVKCGGAFGWRTSAFSPVGTSVLVGWEDMRMILEIFDSKRTAEYWLDGLYVVAWSPDARSVVAGCKNGTLHILKIENYETEP